MFLQQEYNENDARAKAKLIELMKITPGYKTCTLVEPKDPYTVDFHVYRNGGHFANIEVEVKKTWKTKEFTYSDIQLLPRKKKFWEDETHNLGRPTMFVMFNQDLSNHLVILSDKMQEIFSKNDTRHYGTEKTRNDAFYIAKKSDVLFGYFGSREPEPNPETELTEDQKLLDEIM